MADARTEREILELLKAQNIDGDSKKNCNLGLTNFLKKN